MKQRVLSEDAYRELVKSIPKNRSRYGKGKQWLLDSGAQRSQFRDSNIVIRRPVRLKIPDGKEYFDAENAKLIYEQLGDISPVVASDPRLWARLTHVECWDYMLARWQVGTDTTDQTIRARYFFSGTDSRALVRNGVARLWWYAAITHDPKRQNEYELTEAAFLRLDIAQNLFENSFGRSRQLVQAFLDFVLKHRDRCIDEGDKSRRRMRYIASCVNGRTGVGVVDTVSKKRLTEFLEFELDRFDKLPG